MKKHTWIASVLALLLALAGCSEPPTIEREPIPLPKDAEIVSDIETGQYGGMFILSETTQPTTFNYYVPSNMGTVTVLEKLFNALADYNPIKEEIVPALAKSWEVGEDQQTYTFHLREGIKWSDGEPFSADDVIFTYEVILADETDPETGEISPIYPTRYYSELQIDGKKIEFEKVDDYTVRFHTPTIYAPFLYDMMNVAILPKHKLQPFHEKRDFMRAWSTQTGIDHPEEIVGTGPFILESYKPGERLTLRPNPHYWKADASGQRLPYLDRLIFKFVTESNTEIVYFATGQTSASAVGPSDVAWVQENAETYGYTLYNRGLSPYVTMIWLNLNPGKSENGKPYVDPGKLRWFSSKRFRQALMYAFDREAVIDAVFFGRGQPLDSFITPPNGKWHNPDVKKYRYAPEKARALLREEGFSWNKDGRLVDENGRRVEFDLMLPSGGSWEELVVTFKENLDAIGITVNLNPTDFTTLLRKIDYTFDYDAGVIGWGSTSAAYDPSGSKAFFLSEGIYHIWHPKQKKPATDWEARIDQLFTEQEQILDLEQRQARMHEVQDIYAEEVPMFLLASVESTVGIQNRWRNIQMPSAGSMIWNIEMIWTPEPVTE